MPETSGEERARIERANRLRAQIEKLKSGRAGTPGKPPSLREQIEQRSRGAANKEKNPQD